MWPGDQGTLLHPQSPERQRDVRRECLHQPLHSDRYRNLFDGLKRIAKDLTANANSDLIEHAYRMGYLYGEKEYTFLKQTMRKRNLCRADCLEGEDQSAHRGPDRGPETNGSMISRSLLPTTQP